MKQTFYILSAKVGKECLKCIAELIRKRVECEVKISPIKGTKSRQQLGYFHAVVVPAYRSYFNECGHVVSEDIIITWIKKLAGFVENKYDLINGGTYLHIHSKSRMTKEEMSTLIEVAIQWSVEQGFYIPPCPSCDFEDHIKE